MGRDGMGINHREGDRAPAQHRRQWLRNRAGDKGGMWMVELAATGTGGWRGVAFLWDHSILSMSTFWAFLKEPIGTVLSRENVIHHTHPHLTRTFHNSSTPRDRALKSHVVFAPSASRICLPLLPIRILFQNRPLMLSCLFFGWMDG